MNAKNLILSSITGSIVYFLLGWLFYGILFAEIYPASESQNLLFTYLGCLTFSIMVSFIFLQWAGISQFKAGAEGGGIIGLLYGTAMNFFMYSSMTPNYQNMVMDISINAVSGAITGGIMAIVIAKSSSKEA